MKHNQPGDCSSCTERWFCKELCPDAERYIGQDHIPQNPNEHLSGLLPHRPLPHVDSLTGLTSLEIKILRYFVAGLTRKEIAEALDISTNNVYVHTWNIKEKYLKS